MIAADYNDPQALHGCGIMPDPYLEKQNKPYQQLDQLAAQLNAIKPSLYARLLCWIKRKMK